MTEQTDAARAIESTALGRFEPRTLTTAASAHLDLIRAIAASAVMWGHVRAHFFVDYQHLRERNAALSALYFFTGFGHQAVMVFFVLSGFLISASILQARASDRWSWREYGINRASRLYVVLVPGLLFGFLWDKLGSTLFAGTGLYWHALEDLGPAIAQNQLTLKAFFGNLFFVQTILCTTFGSNGPLWSLANEFWYYVLFPVLLFAGVAWAARSTRRAVPLTILAVGLGLFLGWDKLIGFLIWLAGCGLVLMYARFGRVSRRWLIPYLIVSTLALAACLGAARVGRSAILGSDLAVGFAFALFLFGVLHIELGAGSLLYHRVAHFVAGFSYSLYVLHFPFVLFLRAWIASPERWQPQGRHLLFGVVIGVGALTYAWLVSTFTERKTSAVRHRLRRILQ
ncbi:MAG TPA: acyltransferase [Verrucomicrobiae bacterium]|nr:acyltransferase [Verrucomicrobiae bacterium]